MNKTILKIKIIFLLLFIMSGIYAQKAITASGGDVSGTTGTVSFTLGEVVYTSHSGSNGSVAQGVQQPYIITEETSIEEAEGLNLTMIAYPNPATDFLIISIDNIEQTKHTLSQKHKQGFDTDLSYELFNINGRIFQKSRIESTSTPIDMTGLSSSFYHIRIKYGKDVIKTFKIIKN